MAKKITIDKTYRLLLFTTMILLVFIVIFSVNYISMKRTLSFVITNDFYDDNTSIIRLNDNNYCSPKIVSNIICSDNVKQSFYEGESACNTYLSTFHKDADGGKGFCIVTWK